MLAKLLKFTIGATLGLTLASPANAGRVVVNHDEWTLSDAGFTNAGATNVSAFVSNLAGFMNSNGGGCSFLVYSSNFGLTGSSFQTAMTTAGCSLTYDTGAFNIGVGTLASYDGVFLALNPNTYNAAALAAYVNSGGSAYIAAGTGFGGAALEAAHWNAFLNGFGLNLEGGLSYNGFVGTDPVQQSHPLETGVEQLFYNNGNTVSLFGVNPNAQIIEFFDSSPPLGLIGVYDNVAAQVPEPGTLLMLALALLAMLALTRAGRRPHRI